MVSKRKSLIYGCMALSLTAVLTGEVAAASGLLEMTGRRLGLRLVLHPSRMLASNDLGATGLELMGGTGGSRCSFSSVITADWNTGYVPPSRFISKPAGSDIPSSSTSALQTDDISWHFDPVRSLHYYLKSSEAVDHDSASTQPIRQDDDIVVFLPRIKKPIPE